MFLMVLRAGIEQGGHDNNPNDLCCNSDPVITNDMPLRGINVIFCFCSLRSLALSHPSILKWCLGRELNRAGTTIIPMIYAVMATPSLPMICRCAA